MKFSSIPMTLMVATVFGHPNQRTGLADWAPPGENDFRGRPCPMMNTLANHGFLPHDGKNITRPNAISALTSALNFNESLASLMFDMAIIANPEPNATFFTLDQLNRHNVLEHDGSLSRTDAYFGSNHIFNKTIFDQSRAYWTAPMMDATMLANSKIARQIESKAFNPTYRFTAEVEDFSLGEMAAPIIAFGDIDIGTVNRTLVEYFFLNERLPTALGWKKKDTVVNVEDILKVSNMVKEATSLITDIESTQELRRRDLHAGLNTRE